MKAPEIATLLRLKTLTAAVVPVLSGASLAAGEGHEVSLLLLGVILFSALCIQIATNLFNDLKDFDSGVDNEERLGPKRALQQGAISKTGLTFGAFAFVLAALLSGAYIVYQAGLPILIIGLISLVLSYLYTGGPFPLAYRGLGDLFVILFFGIIAVGGTYFIFSGGYSWLAFLLGLQIGMLATVLIAINNLRDIEGDERCGKRTLAVRLGERGAKREIQLLLVFPFLVGLLWFPASKVAALLPLLLFPMAISLSKSVFSARPSEEFNLFLAHSAKIHLAFGLLLCAALLLSPVDPVSSAEAELPIFLEG